MTNRDRRFGHLNAPMHINYYGHSCFGVTTGQARLLFDPFVSQNPLAKQIPLNTIAADFILVSHGHDDHTLDVVEIARRTKATVITSFEVGEWFKQKGLERVLAMNPGGAITVEFGRVKLVPAIHSSSLPDGAYGGQPVGFVVETPGGNFYYSGDTALTCDMKLIGESTRLDWAALCIGDYFTMGIDDAIRAAQFINCRKILGVHYNTFPEIKIDPLTALEAFRQHGIELRLIAPGEGTEF